MPTGQTIPSVMGVKMNAGYTGQLQQVFGDTAHTSMRELYVENSMFIDPFAKFKPFRNNTIYEDRYTDGGSQRFAGLVEANYGLASPTHYNTMAEAAEGDSWTYQKLRHGGTEIDYFRAMDFEGYNPSARPPFFPPSEYKNMGRINVSSYTGTSFDAAEFLHIATPSELSFSELPEIGDYYYCAVFFSGSTLYPAGSVRVKTSLDKLNTYPSLVINRTDVLGCNRVFLCAIKGAIGASAIKAVITSATATTSGVDYITLPWYSPTVNCAEPLGPFTFSATAPPDTGDTPSTPWLCAITWKIYHHFGDPLQDYKVGYNSTSWVTGLTTYSTSTSHPGITSSGGTVATSSTPATVMSFNDELTGGTPHVSFTGNSVSTHVVFKFSQEWATPSMSSTAIVDDYSVNYAYEFIGYEHCFAVPLLITSGTTSQSHHIEFHIF